MRFAVRRPATRPVTPRGHRPPGDVLALPAGPSGCLADRDDRPGAPAPGRRTLARILAAPADVELTGPRSWQQGEREMPGPAELAALTGQTAYVPVEAASPYGPEVLVPARVLSGRPEETAQLGETTDRLLLHHLREGRPTTTDSRGRERRSLPGVQVRALTPRGR